MKRSGPIKRRTPLPRSSTPLRPRNSARRAKNWTRAYGSEERVQWVASQPCSVMGCGRRPCENAHAVGGGIGRKSDYRNVLPLCHAHHSELHDVGVRTFERMHVMDLHEHSEGTERLWQQVSAGAAA